MSEDHIAMVLIAIAVLLGVHTVSRVVQAYCSWQNIRLTQRTNVLLTQLLERFGMLRT